MTPLPRLTIAILAALILLFLHGALLLAWMAFAWFAWAVVRVGTRWDPR